MDRAFGPLKWGTKTYQRVIRPEWSLDGAEYDIADNNAQNPHFSMVWAPNANVKIS